MRNGDARGGCGQIRPKDVRIYGPGWNADEHAKLLSLWDRWHLNDMRSGCEHQRAAAWDTSEALEVVSYKLTHEAMQLRDTTRKAAANAALEGEAFNPDVKARALAELDTWFASIYEPHNADSPLSGCYEVEKRETKAAGWVRQNEHPRGLLGAPCSTCGYKYGSGWLYEHVPADVVAWFEAMPDSGTDDWGRKVA
jgi:hypothetical protein